MNPLSLIAVVLILGFLAWRIIFVGLGINQFFIERLTASALRLFYSRNTIFRAWDHFQQPYFFLPDGLRQPVLPFFLKEVFDPKYVEYSHFLILGPSGIGKTTTLIRLFSNWKYRINQTGYQIRLVSFSGPNIYEYIDQIPDQSKTILLIDGLDTNLNDETYKSRLDKLLKVSINFARIVITCQNGFLPPRVEGRTGDELVRFTGEETYQVFARVELTPWTKQTCMKYASDKLSRFSHRKKLRAHNWILSRPELFEIPGYMVWIKEALDKKTTPLYPFQIIRAAVHSLIGQAKAKSGNKKHIFGFLSNLALSIEKQGYSDWLMDLSMIKKLTRDFEVDITLLGGLLEISGEGYLRFSNPDFYAYFLAWKAFHEGGDIAENLWNILPTAGKYYHQMCWDKFVMSEYGTSSCRLENDSEKRPCKDLNSNQIGKISRVYIKLEKLVDWRFLRGLKYLKGMYLEGKAIIEIPLDLVKEIKKKNALIYLTKNQIPDQVFSVKEREVGNLKNHSVLFDLERIDIHKGLTPKSRVIHKRPERSWITSADVLNLFEKDLTYFPVNPIVETIPGANDKENVQKISGHLGTGEMDLFDMIEWHIHHDNSYNIVLYHDNPSTLLIDYLRQITDSLISLYGEDDRNQAIFSEDDIAQIEDGFWLGRKWAWEVSQSYENPINLYLEEPGKAKLEIYGFRGNFVDLPKIKQSRLSLPE